MVNISSFVYISSFGIQFKVHMTSVNRMVKQKKMRCMRQDNIERLHLNKVSL
jgi:hypothetical protein